MIEKFDFWVGIVVVSIAIGALWTVEFAYSRNAETAIVETCKEAR